MAETRKQKREDKKMLKSLNPRTRKEKREDKKHNSYKKTQKLNKAKEKLEKAKQSGNERKIKRANEKAEKAQEKVNTARKDSADRLRLEQNKSDVTRTESPLARYKCSYNSKKKSKKSSLTKTAFGSLSVEAGIDKNHNATQADRIVGAQKNN